MRYLVPAYAKTSVKHNIQVLWVVGALALGTLYASALWEALSSLRFALPAHPPPPLRVVFAAHSGGEIVAEAPAKLALEALPVLKTAHRSTGEQRLRSTAPAPDPRAAVSAPPAAPPLPYPAPAQASAKLPPGPPAPPDHEEQLKGRVYPQQPGGEFLVLALLVDSHGQVIATKIMVPSAYPLLDMSYQLAAAGKNVGVPGPALKDGDTVWTDLLVHYNGKNTQLP